MGDLFSGDFLDVDLTGGPLLGAAGEHVGTITRFRDGRVFVYEGHHAIPTLTVDRWVDGTRHGEPSGHPVLDAGDRLLGLVGRDWEARSPGGEWLFRAGWGRNIVTADGGEVLVGRKRLPRAPGHASTPFARFGSQRWRLRFAPNCPSELRGLALAAILVAWAHRSGD